MTFKKIYLLVALTCVTVQAQEMSQIADTNATTEVKPYYKGEVTTVEHGGGYTYLEIKEHTDETFWVAVNTAEVNVGDYVRFQKELVMKNFKSKALGRTFDMLMFGSNLEHKIIKGRS